MPIEVFYAIVIGREDAEWYVTAINLTKIFRLRTIVSYSRKIRHVSKTMSIFVR